MIKNPFIINYREVFQDRLDRYHIIVELVEGVSLENKILNDDEIYKIFTMIFLGINELNRK